MVSLTENNMGDSASDSSHKWSTGLLRRAIEDHNSHDPYSEINWDEVKAEKAEVYKFDPNSNQWNVSQHLVKIEQKPFAKGSMRTCFRMKKWSQFLPHPSWKNASCLVAKRYTNVQDEISHRKMVQNDIMVQMVSKYYAELFNTRDPPKKIDVMQVYMVHLPERKGSPCYCVERFLDGKYEKYNSNVGYAVTRNTPQAFSHFSFETSGGSVMVVDVQGVEDLYTDPQIHSIDEDEFGEGNLGLSGFAFFFHTHKCNDICRHFGLTPFDLYPFAATLSLLQKKDLLEHPEKLSKLQSLKTAWKPHSKLSRAKSMEALKINTVSQAHQKNRQSAGVNSTASVISYIEQLVDKTPIEHGLRKELKRKLDELVPLLNHWDNEFGAKRDNSLHHSYKPMDSPATLPGLRVKLLTDQSGSAQFTQVLGKIHRRLAYHFLRNDMLFDVPASSAEVNLIVIYHFKKAAEFGELSAQISLANYYEERPCYELSSLDGEKDHRLSFLYSKMGALNGSKVCMIKLARFYEEYPVELENYPDFDSENRYKEAAQWIEKALTLDFCSEDDSSESFELSVEDYELCHRLAVIFEKSGHGLERSIENAIEIYEKAAELAEMSYKGKKALLFYAEADRLRRDL